MKMKKQKIIIRDSMECQRCVSGRDDVNEQMDRIEAREQFWHVLAFALVLTAVAVVAIVLKKVLIAWEIYSWITLGVSCGGVFVVLVSIAILISIKGAKTDGK
jgi:mannose/fructose/N-acetylgalactosamine-specific phosphotransferase system component IIC